ncbi:hypothetical protein MHZ93_06080 [Roseomonas sp. ACRSG]|nr:hypothetical protein [Roseomonas sp. ACRSG]
MRFIKVEADGEAIDIPRMRELDVDAYAAYVKEALFFVDHHDILRSSFGEYPIATSEQQVRRLIQYLEGVAQRMKEAE